MFVRELADVGEEEAAKGHIDDDVEEAIRRDLESRGEDDDSGNDDDEDASDDNEERMQTDTPGGGNGAEDGNENENGIDDA
jgi:hypothetical protein